jgi:hypothetical protein
VVRQENIAGRFVGPQVESHSQREITLDDTLPVI